MVILDTCTLLWLVDGQDKLSPAARDAISDGRDFIFVSAITAFELSLRHRELQDSGLWPLASVIFQRMFGAVAS